MARQQKPKRQLVINWRPQAKQLQFLRAAGCAGLWGYNELPQADELLYGGAAKRNWPR